MTIIHNPALSDTVKVERKRGLMELLGLSTDLPSTWCRAHTPVNTRATGGPERGWPHACRDLPGLW